MMGETRPLLIGLTGPIGCGKSNVGRVLSELGGTVIDADVLARAVSAPAGPALGQIRTRFGDAVFDPNGELDRGSLAAIVFDDATALADLERIVHPHVRRLLEAALDAAEKDHVPFVALEAIKLVEGGLAERCAEVWVIECSVATQRARLAHRGTPTDDVERRLATQGPDLVARLTGLLGERKGVRRVSTEGSMEETRAVVEDALAEALEAYLAED
ncbi:MAG: dephospho-CoA kinase [Chloroflexota bacterium]|jgi:dephospho-CoA kinase|nr:dephospho-CoA kinase [Chloroflexota bacterium]